MQITKATKDDIPLITAFGKRLIQLHRDFDPSYYTYDEVGFTPDFSTWLDNQIITPSSIVLVAKEDGQVVGFLSGFIKFLFPWFTIKKVGHISFMFIDEAYRRKGVGNQLLQFMKLWFKEQGLSFVELYVNEKNANGLSFWKSMGFGDFQKFLRMRI